MALTKVIGAGLGAVTQDGAATFNEGSADVDFRVESNGNTHMLFVDGGNNALAVGTSSADTNATMTVSNTGDNHAITIVGAVNKSRMHFQGANTGSASTDGLVIGLSSSDDTNDDSALFGLKESGKMTFQTAGTNNMIIDATGAVTKPNQPAFHATPSATLENFAINQYNNVDFATERFDRNADYNAGGGPTAFTAPVTGVYQLNFHLYLLSLDTAATYVQFSIKTSNDEYVAIIDPNFNGDLGYYHMTMGVLADMDANDTAFIRMYQSGGTAQLDVATNSSFSGYLVA